MSDSEKILVSQVKRGERDAQQRLYNIYAGGLLAIAVRYVARRDIAEDILHDAVIKIFASIERFEYRGEGSLKAWMSRIVVNASLEWLRYNKRIDTVEINNAYIEHNPTTEPTHLQTERIPHDKILQLITELPDGYRAVFNLFCIEGYSHREIAQQLNINEKSSSSQLLRAKRLLAKKINKYLDHNEQ